MESHSDFVQGATERSNQVVVAERLFQLAGQPSTLPIEVDGAVLDASSVIIPSSYSNFFTLRSLYSKEIDVLKRQCRCRSNTWTNICILQLRQQSSTDDISQHLVDCVSDTTFDGVVVFVYFRNDSETSKDINSSNGDLKLHDMVAVGIHGCALVSNSIVHINTARVHKCGIISHTYIDAYSFVMNCGYVAAQAPEDTSRRGVCIEKLQIIVGAESGGGRALHLAPESTMIDVSRQVSQPLCNSSNELPHGSVGELNFIGAHCLVRDTPSIFGIYLHPKSSIVGASFIQRALLFPGSKISNGSTVRNVVIQWNGTISDGSSVTDTFLMEHASVGPRSVVSNTVLGPDVHVSCGEVHVSILGPNTNAHHQSLVIASLWPCGRGNVGYGANVGSNHTGRIPDQECCIGEGIFWGLSCVVKLPIDLTCAPYTIIAAGTILAPQRCTMPFSLICNHAEGKTCIVPGWLLQHSPYTIVRSEQKFAQRRKAIRHANYTGWSILRPDIISLCWRARQALLTSGKPNSSINKTTLYSSDSIPGLGANVLTEKGRLIGIQAYTDCIQQFALQGLYTFLVNICIRCRKNSLSLSNILLDEFRAIETPPVVPNETIQWPTFPWDQSTTPTTVWDSQRGYLLSEFPWQPDKVDVVEWALDLLDRHVDVEQKYADRVYQCKHRDDVRGVATVPDYTATHVPAEDESVVLSVRKNLEVRIVDVQKLRETISELVR
jgi:Domain of unknown function (DUF4954)